MVRWFLAAAAVALVVPSQSSAQSSAPECDGSFSGPSVRQQMLLEACRHAHNVPADGADPSAPVGEQFLIFSTKVRRPGVVRDGELRYVTFTAKRVESGERVTWPMVFRVAGGRVSVEVAERCRPFSAGSSVRPTAVERAYITQVGGNGECPPDFGPLRVLMGRVFARGDRARIRAAVRRRARESGWRRVGRVEILSASSVGGLSTANLLVWARRGGMGQCEAEAWWTPGFEPVIRSKDVLLEGTGSCVPVEDPR